MECPTGISPVQGCCSDVKPNKNKITIKNSIVYLDGEYYGEAVMKDSNTIIVKYAGDNEFMKGNTLEFKF